VTHQGFEASEVSGYATLVTIASAYRMAWQLVSPQLAGLASGGDYAHHRWTLDTPEDAIVIGKLLEALPEGALAWRDALAIAEAHPEWQAINAAVEQRRVT
jgi:hypothetical protein